jgi:hypothetical protein
MKKAPTANATMIKSDGFAWHTTFFSKTAQAIITHFINYNMAT